MATDEETLAGTISSGFRLHANFAKEDAEREYQTILLDGWMIEGVCFFCGQERTEEQFCSCRTKIRAKYATRTAYFPHQFLPRKTQEVLTQAIIQEILLILERPHLEWSADALQSALKQLPYEYSWVRWILRVSLTGQEYSPPGEEIAIILGKEEVVARLQRALSPCD